MPKKKYLFSLVGVLLALLSIPKINDHFSHTLAQSLNKEGYKTIFEGKNQSFEKWIIQFSNFKEELIKEKIINKDILSDKDGAFLLKQWCKESLKSKSSELLEKTKKYCTMSLEIYALDNKGFELISQIKDRKRRRSAWGETFAKHSKKIMQFGEFRKHAKSLSYQQVDKFKSWCRKRGKEPFIPKNYFISENFATWCVTKRK